MSEDTEVEILGYKSKSVMENKIGVYTLTHLSSNKQYHGSTVNISRRKQEHKGDLKHGNHANENMRKAVLEDPIFRLTFTPTESIDEAKILEQERIDSTPKDLLMNLSLDTENCTVGLWKNPDIRRKIMMSRIGNQNAKDQKWTEERRDDARQRMRGNKHLLGYTHSEDTRKKMSDSGKNKPERDSESYRRSPEASAKQGETITKYRAVVDGIEFKNMGEAAKCMGIARTTLEKRCKSEFFPNYQKILKD